MKTYEAISKDEIRDLLCANWTTHDSMRLMNSVKQYGMKETNAINKSSVRMMAKIEAKRLKIIMKADNPKSIPKLKSFLSTAYEIIR